jgi:hypothetical protein
MIPTSIEQHLIEMGLLTLEELQARQAPLVTSIDPRKSYAFIDPRDENGEIPF